MKTNEAVQAAIDEGRRIFFAATHVGGRCEWCGSSWEDGGYTVNKRGNPVCDQAGNTVARSSVTDIDPDSEADRKLCDEWYGE